MTEESEQLLRYADREMSAEEAQAFRVRLAESPALRQKLQEMRRVGRLVRLWSSAAERRAEGLLEPTLHRVRQAQRREARAATFCYALVAVLVLALPWSRPAERLIAPTPASQPAASDVPAPAAIERIDAGDTKAQVFMVGSSATPVVWLADDAQDDTVDSPVQGPG